MHSTTIRDPRVKAITANLWTLRSSEDQRAAAEAALSALPTAPGLVRFSVFRGLEEPTLFVLSQWADAAVRDALSGESPHLAAGDLDPRWRETARPARTYVSGEHGESGCLVIVRQPLVRADPAVQRDWVDTVLTALEADPQPPVGLLAATFFLAEDGAHVLNLAEWTSAEAHRAALRPTTAPRSRHGTLGVSPLWQAVRAHPGIRPEHEVRRFVLHGAAEPLRDAERAGTVA